MTIRTRITTAGAALASAGLLVATPTAQAAPDGTDRADARTEGNVQVLVVLDGSLDGQLGNQHRLFYDTDPTGYASRALSIESYYCPSGTGAKITRCWTSTRGIDRGTRYLDSDTDDYWVSSTVRSGKVAGRLTSGWKSFDANLTLRATEEPQTIDGIRPGYSRLKFAHGRVYGTVDDARVRPSSDNGETTVRLHRHLR